MIRPIDVATRGYLNYGDRAPFGIGVRGYLRIEIPTDDTLKPGVGAASRGKKKTYQSDDEEIILITEVIAKFSLI